MRLPYFKNKTYLSGIDWIISAIDYYLIRTSGTGNHSTLIINLEKKISIKDLDVRLQAIYQNIPVLSGNIKRDKINLAPYWYCKKKRQNTYQIFEHKCENKEEFETLKFNILNEKFKFCYQHLKFNIINGPEMYYLLMTFDHKILDAHGAEMFLQLLNKSSEEKIIAKIREIKQTNAAKLINWQKKFDAGRDIQRHLIQMSKNECETIGSCTIKDTLKNKCGQAQESLTTVYTEQETKVIKRISEKRAGFMMETAFFLAVCTKSINSVLSENKPLCHYSIPMPIDMRGNCKGLKKMLRNHLSFMFLKIEFPQKATIEEISTKYKHAILNEVSNEYPEKLEKATRLARICPLGILYRFMSLSMKGKVCSFAFSNLGESNSVKDILGSEIKCISHMPRVPTPPGIGFFFNTFSKKLQFTVIWNKAIIEKNQVNAIVNKINECFKEEE
jgi:hypothetical protein